MNVTNPTDPGVLFGGTWKKISYRYLIGEGAIEKNTSNGFGSVDAQVNAGWTIGGAGATFGEILHKLSVDEMPSHNHYLGYTQSEYTATQWKDAGLLRAGEQAYTLAKYSNATGGNQDHNNMPPSMIVYMWQRIA